MILIIIIVCIPRQEWCLKSEKEQGDTSWHFLKTMYIQLQAFLDMAKIFRCSFCYCSSNVHDWRDLHLNLILSAVQTNPLINKPPDLWPACFASELRHESTGKKLVHHFTIQTLNLLVKGINLRKFGGCEHPTVNFQFTSKFSNCLQHFDSRIVVTCTW